MSKQPESVEASSAIRARLASLTPEQQKPGTLTEWADAQNSKYYEFIGNGQITGADLVGTVVNREAQKKESGLQPFDGNQEFARFAANQMLSRGDTKYEADKPIPKGQVEEISLKELVALATPFLQKYAESVRAHDGVTPAGGGGSEEEHRKLTGQLHSVGLTLPLDH